MVSNDCLSIDHILRQLMASNDARNVCPSVFSVVCWLDGTGECLSTKSATYVFVISPEEATKQQLQQSLHLSSLFIAMTRISSFFPKQINTTHKTINFNFNLITHRLSISLRVCLCVSTASATYSLGSGEAK